MTTFKRLPSNASSFADPMDFEAWSNVKSHRLKRDPAEDEQHDKKFQALEKSRTRDMRVLLSLRSQTAQISKGATTDDKVEHTMRTRAEEAAHAAADRHIQQLKRRLAQNATKNFVISDKDDSGELDFDEWVAAFGQEHSDNPLVNAGAIDVSVLRRLFDELDIDKDGKVSVHEFITGVLNGHGQPETEAKKLTAKKMSVETVQSPSPQPLESPLTRYRRRNRAAKFAVPELRKCVDNFRYPCKVQQGQESDEDAAGEKGSFFESLGMDTGIMEAEEIKAKVQHIFELFDDDESGYLEFFEVKQGLQSFGIKLTNDKIVELIERVGAGSTMECNAEQFQELLLLVPTEKESVPPRPIESGQGTSIQSQSFANVDKNLADSNIISSKDDQPCSSSSSESESESESESKSESEVILHEGGEQHFKDSHDDPHHVSLDILPTPPHLKQKRMRSPRCTQLLHDDVLQTRLKNMESSLKTVINSSKAVQQEAFSSDIQTGKVVYIAAEMKHMNALYSGPLNKSGNPEGIGAIDYRKFGDARGRLTAERRQYYLGSVVAGKRQGFGLIRWMDRTEYCGTWIADMPDGLGVETYEDGSWYAGGFKKDKRHGMGGFWAADGYVYIGQWQNGVRHGSGIIGHVDTVDIDLKDKGQTETVKLEMDMVDLKVRALFNPLSRRAKTMKTQMVESLFKLRFNNDAPKTMHPVFVTEFDRGVRQRSIFFSNRVVEHQGLLQDAVFAVESAQSNGSEALEFAREGWMVLQQAIGANVVRETRKKQKQMIHLKKEVHDSQDTSVSVVEAEEEQEDEREVDDKGLLLDSLEVTQLRAEQLAPKKLLLCLRVLCARNLEAMDLGGSSDPYAVIALGDHKFRSSIIRKDLNPRWDQDFSLLVHDWSVPLKVSVWDHDVSSADDLIGECEVWLEDIMEDIRRNGDKDLHSPARLRVTVLRAKNLIAADAGGTSDPYVRLHIGCKPSFGQTTVVKKKTLNPIWNQTFEFEIGEYERREVLTIECFDKDVIGNDDSLGKIFIELETLPLQDSYSSQTPESKWHAFEKKIGRANKGQVELLYELVRTNHQDAIDPVQPEANADLKLEFKDLQKKYFVLEKVYAEVCRLEPAAGDQEMKSTTLKELENVKEQMIELHRKTTRKSIHWVSLTRDKKARGEIQLGFTFLEMGASSAFVDLQSGQSQVVTSVAEPASDPTWTEEPLRLTIESDWSRLRCTVLHEDPTEERKQVLVVSIHRARKLKAMDSSLFGKGTSDPYVIIQCGDEKKKTAIISKNLNPVWEETFTIPIWGDPETPLQLSVWDYDALSADDTIGEASISISNALRTPIRKWYEITAEGQTTGEVEVGIHIQDPFAQDVKLLAIMKVVGARNLEAMDVGGSSDPYAIIKLGDQERSTTIIQKSLNPVWNEEFVLSVDEIYQPIEISIWDNDAIGADDMIGETRVFLPDLVGKERSQEWYTLKLNGRTHGEVLLSLFLTDLSIQSMGEYLGETSIQVRDLGYSGRTQAMSMELGTGVVVPDLVSRRYELVKRVLTNWLWGQVEIDDHKERAHNVLQQWHMIAHYKHVHGNCGVRHPVSDGLRISSYNRQGILTAPVQGKLFLEVRAFSSLAQHGAILLNPRRMPPSEKALRKGATLERYQGNVAACQEKLLSLREQRIAAQAQEAEAHKNLDSAQAIADRLRQVADDAESEGLLLMDEAIASGGLLPTDVHYAQWQIDQQRRRTLQEDAERVLASKLSTWEGANEVLQAITTKIETVERDEAYLLGHNPIDMLDIQSGSQEAAIGVLQATVICAQRLRVAGYSSISDMPCWVKLSIGEEICETSLQVGSPGFLWNEAFRMLVKKGSHHLKAEILCKTPIPDKSHEPATLIITVLSAQNLLAADRGGTSDPYVRMHIGDAVREGVKTKTVKKSFESKENSIQKSFEFNETFKFRLSGSQRFSDLTIECFNYNVLRSDDSLGRFSLGLESLVFDQECTEWFKLENGESDDNEGQVHLRYKLLHDLPPAKLEISVLRAEDLVAADRGGTSDPYVRLHIGNAIGIAKKTKVQTKTLNPEWNQTFSFQLAGEKRREILTVECFDYDMVGKDDSLGKFQIELDSLGIDQEYDEWRMIGEGDEKNKGQMRVRYRLVPDKQGPGEGITSLGTCRVALRDLEEGIEDLKWWTVGNGGTSRGRLLIRVEEAKNLNSNLGQPTCRVWLRLGKESVKTLSSYSTSNPKWTGEPFAFDLNDSVQRLTVDVLLQGQEEEEDFLGRAFVSVTDVLHQIQITGTFDAWLTLQERYDSSNDLISGSVRIIATFDPASSPSWGQMKLLLNYEHHKRVLPEEARNLEEERLISIIASAIDDGNIDEEEQKAIKEAEKQLEDIHAQGKAVGGHPKYGRARVTVYEIRNSFISHVHALRTAIVVDDRICAQTELTKDLKNAVWDEVFDVDVPLYSQFVKAAAVGQEFVLCLKVIMGKDLEAMDINGTSDPYVKIRIGKSKDLHKTRIIYKNLNPEWDEDFEMIIQDMSVPLHVSVWDNDLLGSDDLIGECWIRLDELMDTHPTDGQLPSFNEWFTVKRDRKATGDIQLGFCFKEPDIESPETETELGSVTLDVSRMQVGDEQIGWHRLAKGPEHFTLSVSILQASSVMPVDGVTADPFVKISVGKQTFQTPHVKQNCNPLWSNEQYNFRVKSLNDVMKIELFDYNAYSSHVFIGEYRMQMKSLMLDEETDRWYELSLRPSQQDFVADRHRDGERLGEIRIKLNLRKTRVPACELKLGMKLLRLPPVKMPHRNDRIVHLREVRGVGTLEFTVVSAANLQGFDNCRPWVEVHVGDQHELVKRARGGDHPCWDCPLSLPVAPGTEILTCKIMTKGPKKRKYMLGETTIILDQLMGKGLVDKWYRLDGRNCLGKLIVRIISAENLLAADSNGKSDPFVELTVGKQKRKSKTKMRTLNPVYEEEFAFDVWDVKDKVDIEIYDWDAVGSNDLLGRKTFVLADLFATAQGGNDPGEGSFTFAQRCRLEGLQGTDFVDPEQTERVQGSIKLEMSYLGDPELVKKVGYLRMVMNYIVPAKSKKEAEQMEMELVEGVDDDINYDPWDDSPFRTVEQQLIDALGPFPKACLSKAKLSSSHSSFQLSDASLDAQMSIFKSMGGQVASAKQLATVRSASRPPTILGPGSASLTKKGTAPSSDGKISGKTSKGDAPSFQPMPPAKEEGRFIRAPPSEKRKGTSEKRVRLVDKL